MVDYYGEEEPIELGPDENMHDEMIEFNRAAGAKARVCPRHRHHVEQECQASTIKNMASPPGGWVTFAEAANEGGGHPHGRGPVQRQVYRRAQRRCGRKRHAAPARTLPQGRNSMCDRRNGRALRSNRSEPDGDGADSFEEGPRGVRPGSLAPGRIHPVSTRTKAGGPADPLPEGGKNPKRGFGRVGSRPTSSTAIWTHSSTQCPWICSSPAAGGPRPWDRSKTGAGCWTTMESPP